MNKFQTKGLIAGAAACVAVGLCVLLYTYQTIEVRIPRDKIQEMVNTKMPFTGGNSIIGYTINSTTIGLRRDGKIDIESDVTTKFLYYTAEFMASGTGTPDYKDGSFYIKGVQFGPVAVLNHTSDPEKMATDKAYRPLLDRAYTRGLRDEFNTEWRAKMED